MTHLQRAEKPHYSQVSHAKAQDAIKAYKLRRRLFFTNTSNLQRGRGKTCTKNVFAMTFSVVSR